VHFFCLFSKIYAYACCVFESLDNHKMECMHVCASQGTYSHDMLMKCMFMANNGVIVMNLILHTRKGEGKGRK